MLVILYFYDDVDALTSWTHTLYNTQGPSSSSHVLGGSIAFASLKVNSLVALSLDKD
jgi:hypothetical protein